VINSRSASSAPAGYRFPREVIAVGGALVPALRPVLPRRRGAARRAWHRGRSRDGVPTGADVHLIDAARPDTSLSTGDRWFVDETYVKVAGRWTYLYRAIDQHGQVIDVLVSARRDGTAARTFFTRALPCGPSPVEVTTDRAPVYPHVIDELVPAARHVLAHYSNNAVEADHGRLKARLRPMRGLKTALSLRTIAAGHAFVQNLHRGHYELAVDVLAHDRVRAAFTELALCL
jgi:transposase, IS6 family